MVQVSYVFASTDTIDASKLNTNFSDLTSALSQLRSSNLATDAGLVSTQLANRYYTDEFSFFLLPLTADTAANDAAGAAGTGFSVPAALTDMFKRKITLKSSQECYLSEVELYAAASVIGTADYVTFAVKKGSTTLGGSAVTLNASDAYFRIRASNPLDNALCAVQDGDEFTFQLGTTGGGGAPTARGLFVRMLFKKELIS